MNSTMQYSSLLVVGCLVAVCSACASIAGYSSQLVSLTSTPLGAEVMITNERNIIQFRGITPCSVYIYPGDGYFRHKKLTAFFTFDGQYIIKQPIPCTFNPWYTWGNFLFLILSGG